MKQFTTAELQAIGARGTATAKQIAKATGDPQATKATCQRCGAIINVGDPVNWSTTGPNAGRLICPRTTCGNPAPSHKKGTAAKAAPTAPKAAAAAATTAPAPSPADAPYNWPPEERGDQWPERKSNAEAMDEILAYIRGQGPQRLNDEDCSTEPSPPVANYLRRKNFDGLVDVWLKGDPTQGIAPKRNFLFIGDTGTGKTEIAKALAAERGVPSLIVSMTIDNPIKEFLVKMDIKDGSTVRLPGHLVEMLERASVVCFDEINFLPPKYTAKFFELLANGKLFLPELGRTIKRHPDNIIIFTANPASKAMYRGVEALNAALVERMVHFNVPSFTGAEIRKITQCTPEVSAFLVHLRKALEAGSFSASIGIRSMKMFFDNIRLFDLKFALKRLDDTIFMFDPRTLHGFASKAAVDKFPELTGNKGGN